MSRNGSGTYTKVNTFVAGASITAAGHNQNWDDIASEMTNSVAVDGQSTMTGALKAASGTVAAPGITFGSDTDSGLYRIGANNIGVAVNGAKVLDVATTGAAVTGTLSVTGTFSATGAISQNGFALLPVGLILPYAAASAPNGYLLCYGQAISRTTYSALFAIIGTSYGAGDGSTTFNVPDLRGRVVAGLDGMGGTLAGRLDATGGMNGTGIASVGGAQTRTLVTANLPAYTPSGSVSITAIIQTTRDWSNVGVNDTNTLACGNTGGTTRTNGVPFSSGTASFTGTAQGGSSTPVVTVQPTMAVTYIIFAGV